VGDAQVYALGAAAATERAFVRQAATLLNRLVANGAALGWVDPPDQREVAELLADVASDVDSGDACLVAARRPGALAGLGYWRRYARPTHRPHADVEKVAVAPEFQGEGVGRALMSELVRAAQDAGIEVLTLDFRADNERAALLYRSLGFSQYGRLPRFVAVGDARYDKLFYALDLRATDTMEE
jgi:ribosomal protein S18 acetylase RimI-like enzyme